MNNCKIDDISFLGKLIYLRQLDISCNNINNFDVITKLTNLEILDIR